MCNALKSRQTQAADSVYSLYPSLYFPLNGTSLKFVSLPDLPSTAWRHCRCRPHQQPEALGLAPTELRCIGSWSEHANPEYYSAHTVPLTPRKGPTGPHQGHGGIVLREREKEKALSHKEDFCKQLEPAQGEHRQRDDLTE
jgi:hypothetical protein